MKKYILSLAAVCCMLTFFSISASALEYSFDAPDAGLFGRPTSDDTIYVTTDEPANTNRGKDAAYIPPAFGSPTSYTLNTEERLTPNLVGSSSAGTVSGTGGVTVLPSNGAEGGSWSYQPIGYTAVTSDLYYSGGYLATLKIPTLDLSVKVYQGTDADALRKGAGHFASTSIWDGNVAIAGHNRGVNNHFGRIHLLDYGDTIKLTTKLGTRTYEVYAVYSLTPGMTVIAKEVRAKDGYILDDTPQSVKIKRNSVMTLEFRNQPKGGVLVKKVDAVTNAPISDVEFLVTDSDGNLIGNANGKFVTDSAGTFTITDIIPDTTLIIKETRTKDGYILDDTPQTVKVKSNEVVTVEFRNQPKGNLIVVKQDSVTKAPLEGVQFKIVYANGSYVDADSGTLSSTGLYWTDKDGKIALSGISGTVVVTEVETIPGYTIDENSRTQTVVVDPNDTQTLYFYNTPAGGLQIIKSDESSGKRISGVRFEVRKVNGEIVGTYTTDSDGVIYLPEIESGWYTVTELKVAPGYLLDTASHRIEVKDGQTATLGITNHKSSRILLHKVDKDTGKGIYGAVFLLYDSNHNPIGEYVTDQDGYIYADDGLADGRYYLREIKAADGYVLDPELKTIYLRYGSTTEIEWTNTPIRGQIQIVKKSADYNPTNGLPAGSLLEGAVFEVYDKAGNVVDTIRTDRNGRATSKLLPLSRYTIREVRSPAFYSANPTVMTAYLDHEGQIVTFEVTNASVNTGVAIKKTGPSEVMPDQPIRYTFSQIGNTSNIALDSFYWRDTLPAQVTVNRLVTGTYNQAQNYKIVYKVNGAGAYRTLADNLSTTKNYVLDMRPAVIGLAANERVTEIMFVFGTVPAGFAQVETPVLYGTVCGGLSNGTNLVNSADVGGLYNGQWVQAVSRWLTTVYAKMTMTLPKTGY